MDNSNPKSGFTLENIILIESSFKRISDVIFDKKAQNSFDINVGVASAEPRIAVTVDVTVAQKRDEVEQFRITAKWWEYSRKKVNRTSKAMRILAV